LGIISYSSLEKILADGEVFALRFDAQGETRLGLIVRRRQTRVPGHMPCGHVPKQDCAWLQCCDLAKQQQHTTPFGPLPSRVRLNKKEIGDDGTKSTQRRDESELPKLFAQIEVKLDALKTTLPMLQSHCTLGRQPQNAEHQHQSEHEQRTRHNSLP